MHYEIRETAGLGPARRVNVIASADSLDGAITLARALFTIVDLEIDPLNPHCADFYTACNRVMQIEPHTT